MTVSVLFVCLGNICRSPTAHGVFQSYVDQAGLSDTVLIDSCGTASFHVGAPPDKRSIQAAAQRDYALENLRARQFTLEDFEEFDYILPMDRMNLGSLDAMASSSSSPYKGRLNLFLDYSQQRTHKQVPDPYYEGVDGFELVLDLVEDASKGLLDVIQKEL